MGTNYGPYVMYILSQLMQKRQSGPINAGSENKTEKIFSEKVFGEDETAADWHKETDLELLKHFCREGYAQAARHGHFLIGTSETGSYIAIPGRFLLEDQPAGGKTGFTLWQPLRGGERMYTGLDDMDDEAARTVYGYWIAGLDSETLEISEA